MYEYVRPQSNFIDKTIAGKGFKFTSMLWLKGTYFALYAYTTKLLLWQRIQKTTTLGYVIGRLRLKRKDNKFTYVPEGFSMGNGKCCNPGDLTIVETYRFEGNSDPPGASILYVIEANDGLIGHSIDAYAVYSNHEGEG